MIVLTASTPKPPSRPGASPWLFSKNTLAKTSVTA
jgi:hypothetical protein